MVLGLLQLGLATTILAAMVWLLLHSLSLCDRVETLSRRRRDRGHLHPSAPPVERIVADLRRLEPLARRPSPGTPMARRRAVRAAYDDALVDACRALGLPDTLTGLPEGADREAERLRVEHLLGQAGVLVRDRAA